MQRGWREGRVPRGLGRSKRQGVRIGDHGHTPEPDLLEGGEWPQSLAGTPEDFSDRPRLSHSSSLLHS